MILAKTQNMKKVYTKWYQILPEYIIWYKKSGKEFSEISCQDCVGRTKCFDEASAFQYNPEVKCQNIWWKSSIFETWMSQSEIQPTLFYCFDVKRNCPSGTCLSETTECFKQPNILPSCFGTLCKGSLKYTKSLILQVDFTSLQIAFPHSNSGKGFLVKHYVLFSVLNLNL